MPFAGLIRLEDCSRITIFRKMFLLEDRRNRKMKKLLTLTIGLAALAFTGCESTSNTNANAAVRNANSNTAVVVNNNGNTTVVQTTNTNRWANTSNVNRADYDRDRAEYERDRGNSKIGTGANDSWIWFKTRAALLTTAGLRESTYDVDVENGVVTLRGTVASKEESTKAEQTAKGIENVTKVNNQLKVAPNDSMTNTGGSSDGTRSNANANRR
jgi:osmotically-inducible protein OsmY